VQGGDLREESVIEEEVCGSDCPASVVLVGCAHRRRQCAHWRRRSVFRETGAPQICISESGFFWVSRIWMLKSRSFPDVVVRKQKVSVTGLWIWISENIPDMIIGKPMLSECSEYINPKVCFRYHNLEVISTLRVCVCVFFFSI